VGDDAPKPSPVLLATPLVVWLWASCSEPLANDAWLAMCGDCQQQAVDAAKRLGLINHAGDFTRKGTLQADVTCEQAQRWGPPRPLRACALTA